MRLNTLKMLVNLIETGSFSMVADKLGITQPAVSIQIKSLEEFFATELFIRQGREIELTPVGKIVYRQAKEILNKWEQAKLEVEKLRGETYGKLVIGASTIPAEYLLPELLVKFYNKLPEVKVIMKVGDSADMVKKLNNRDIDIALVGFKPDKKQFQVIPVVKDSLVLILPKEHNLLNQKQLKIMDLKQERMLIREEGSGTRKAMLAGFKEVGIGKNDLNIMTCLGSTEAIISGVEAGLGISFVSKLAARKAVINGRVEQKEVIDMLISRKLYLAYQRDNKGMVLIKEFLNVF